MAEPKDPLDFFKAKPFLDGPTEFITKSTVSLLMQTEEWKGLFRSSMDIYERIDYSDRAFPALRVYCHQYTKQHESHYIEGQIMIDVLWPPALRREEQQLFADTVAAAMVQQLRRPGFFSAMRAAVPGLNEYGKVVSVDKGLVMNWKEGELPMMQLQANFRIDLKDWDAYLEKEGRTKDDPFEITLGALREITVSIQALNDDGSNGPAVPLDHKIGV